MTAQVLLLHGSPGSGKTTLGEAIAERLRQANLASALIDLDALAIVHPYQGRSFTRANLRAVWPNYAAVPDVRVVLPLVIRGHDDLRELKEITNSARFLVCELTAPREVLERRVIEREPNDFWRSRVLKFIELYHDRDDHPSIRDLQVPTHAGSVVDTAMAVIHRCGWSEAPMRGASG